MARLVENKEKRPLTIEEVNGPKSPMGYPLFEVPHILESMRPLESHPVNDVEAAFRSLERHKRHLRKIHHQI